MTDNNNQSWKFTSSDGSFTLENPQNTSYLYFPLVNEAGMMSAMTPLCHGDAKISQHAFLLPPASVEDLHTTRYARNFWVYVEGGGAWSATGNSAVQQVSNEDEVTLDAGFLWHQITRENDRLGIKAEIVNFVPATTDTVELMKVKLVNTGSHPLRITPTAAIPIYGRSADNIRDHRNVTSMLHRIRCIPYGVSVRPTLSFDERGHQPNSITYAVLGADGDGTSPRGFFPVQEDFTGEGKTLEWPEAILHKDGRLMPVGTSVDGYEAFGGLRFRQVEILPGSSYTYILILAILNEPDDSSRFVETYATTAKFDAILEVTKSYWRSKLDILHFQTGDAQFNQWCQWVTLQPMLRRLYGCSFLPYHDYGRGGRGWRDLWQDILALLLTERGAVDALLFGNFAGVRLDGSNATIIGNHPGEFKADRNNIPRVWMDHGAWPLLTTYFYINQTGDLDFLFRQQFYFKDNYIQRCTMTDFEWVETQGTKQLTIDGSEYLGSVLEHLLVQHLIAFFHVGDHNNIRLEGADWNDGMDMARTKGESVAFTAFYAENLYKLIELMRNLTTRGINEIALADEMLVLLDTLYKPVDYSAPAEKRAHLEKYFSMIRHFISGNKTSLPIIEVVRDLQTKVDWLINHLRKNEWITNNEGYSWYNGYYDDIGKRLEGNHPNGVRMTLTGQVFPIMGRVATNEQVQQIIRTAKHYLYTPMLRGYRLNTDFGEVKLNMGRCFGYAFGHKENGAMFSHMAVMYAYALYERGYVREGYEILSGIYQQSVDFQHSRMYPGIPEYFNNRGRGMYPYLTGSASWYLLTLVTRVFGIYGILGDLAIHPKLVLEQFNEEGKAFLIILFAGKILELVFMNNDKLDFMEYRVGALVMDGVLVRGYDQNGITILPRVYFTDLDESGSHKLEIQLIHK